METIKIQHPNDENDFLIINKRDFDPEKHVEWVDPAERKQGGSENDGQGSAEGGVQNGGEDGLPDVPEPKAASSPEVKEPETQEQLPEQFLKVPAPAAASSSSSKKGKK